MIEARKVSMRWLVVAAVGGIAVGAAGRSAAGRASSCATGAGAGASKRSCCHGQNEAGAAKCPAHYGDKGLEIDDQKETDRLRRALLDGIFVPWTEMGRAPTPAEF